jgi:hypothetical protein
MNRLEKCEYAIEQGYTYDPVTGKVYSRFGRELISKGGVNKSYLDIWLIKDKKRYHLLQHQFAWYYTNREVVDCIDHINGNKTDNTIVNLRSITQQQNTFNTKAKGYHWHKGNKKWVSKIRLNNKQITLGYHNTEEEASNSYLQAKEIYHSIQSV